MDLQLDLEPSPPPLFWRIIWVWYRYLFTKVAEPEPGYLAGAGAVTLAWLGLRLHLKC